MNLTRELEPFYIRPCFICKQIGWCKHREPQVELALIRAAQASMEIKTKAVAA